MRRDRAGHYATTSQVIRDTTPDSPNQQHHDADPHGSPEREITPRVPAPLAIPRRVVRGGRAKVRDRKGSSPVNTSILPHRGHGARYLAGGAR